MWTEETYGCGEPTVMCAVVGNVGVVVHKHIRFDDTWRWVMDCHALGIHHEPLAEGLDAEAAKRRAAYKIAELAHDIHASASKLLAATI